MTGLQASGALFLLVFSSLGSTCHGQATGAGGNGAETKDPAAAPTDVTLPGVDTSMLTPREKREWSQHVSELLAPCSDTPVSISQCVLDKRNCSRCVPAARYILHAVRDGMSSEQIEKSYHNRFDADRVKNVALDGSPAEGPESAPVTVVEFADFECPFCAMEAPLLDKMWQAHKTQVRFVYKFFPLTAHPHGESSARAAIAAMNQGKFWEMHDMLFANRDHLEQADVDGYAKQLGLDVAKLHTDMAAQATTDRIDRDKKLGESVGVQGTPTIFINGRDYDLHQDIDEWIAMDVQASGAEPVTTPAPSGAASAAPAASAATASKKK